VVLEGVGQLCPARLPGDRLSPYGEAPAEVFFASVWNLAKFVAEVKTDVLAIAQFILYT